MSQKTKKKMISNHGYNLKKTILFYRQYDSFGFFSNFSYYPIILENKKWNTNEHYFQAKKFEGTKWEEIIRKTKSPSKAKKYGNRRDLPFRKDWEKVKEKFMYECCLAKFTQHKNLKKKILETGNKLLVEHTRYDRYWADGGSKGKGKNRLGIILMKVREEIKKMEEEKKKKNMKVKL